MATNWLSALAILLTVQIAFHGASTSLHAADSPARTDGFGDPLPENAICRIGSVRFRHDTAEILCVAVSPDGRTIASGGEDRTIRLWDANTGQAQAVLRGHKDDVTGVAFSTADGTLASCDRDGNLIIWEVANERARMTIERVGAFFNAIQFSPDGMLVAAVGPRHVFAFRANNGDPRWQTGLGSFRANEFDFSPDGESIVVVGRGTSPIVLLQTDDGSVKAQWGRDPKGRLASEVKSVSFSPNGKTVVTGSRAHSVRLWDVNSQKPIPFGGLENGSRDVRRVRFAPSGESIAVNTYRELLLFDLASGKQRWGVAAGQLAGLAYSPSGDTILGVSHSVRKWRSSDGNERVASVPRVLTAEFVSKGELLNAATSIWNTADGSLVYDCDSDGRSSAFQQIDEDDLPWLPNRIINVAKIGPVAINVRGSSVALTDCLNRKLIAQIVLPLPKDETATIQHTIASRDGTVLVHCTTTPTHRTYVHVVDVSVGKVLCQFPWPQFADDVRASITTDGKTVVATDMHGGPVIILEVDTGDIKHRLDLKGVLKGTERSLQLSADGRFVVIRDDKSEVVSLWDIENGCKLEDVSVRKSATRLAPAAFDPMSQLFATVSYLPAPVPDMADIPQVKLFGLKDRKSSILAGASGTVQRLIFSPSGRYLAATGHHECLWDLETEDVIYRSRDSEDVRQWSNGTFRFSGDSRLGCWADRSGTIQFVDLRSGATSTIPDIGPSPIRSLKLDADSKRLVILFANGTALVWSMDQVLARLEAQ